MDRSQSRGVLSNYYNCIVIMKTKENTKSLLGWQRRVLRRKALGHLIPCSLQSFPNPQSTDIPRASIPCLLTIHAAELWIRITCFLIFLHRSTSSNKRLENNLRFVYWFSHTHLIKSAFLKHVLSEQCLWLHICKKKELHLLLADSQCRWEVLKKMKLVSRFSNLLVTENFAFV